MHLRRDHEVSSFFCVTYPAVAVVRRWALCVLLSEDPCLLCGKDTHLASGRTSTGEIVMCSFGGIYWMFCFAGGNRGGCGVC